MRILVTGGAGFIGSHIVDAYIKKSHKVFIIDNLSKGYKKNINPKASFYECDLQNFKKTEQIIKNTKPQVINHHAALISIKEAKIDPNSFFKVNLYSFANLLRAAVNNKVKKIIFPSSAAVYAKDVKLPTKEDDRLLAKNIYGLTKLSAEYLLKVYAKSFKLKYAILRYGNVYGPRQRNNTEGGVISIFIKKALSTKSAVIYGNGKQTRDFIYVDDVVDANLKLLNYSQNILCNISTGKKTSINKLINKLEKILNINITHIYKHYACFGVLNSCLNNSYAQLTIGWRPEFSLQEGLKKTIEYYKLVPNNITISS